ncbi:hypothetical protein H0X32_02890 [Patescibacteria group bacterium]|nr:hypothetical protein [Patescibacteria group bacterium]
MNTDSVKIFIHSRLFAGIIVGVSIVVIVIFVFEAGILVGYHEAQFSSQWGENYEQNFGGNTGISRVLGMPDGHGPNPHGTFGKILSVSPSAIVIINDQQAEQKILLGTTTIIRSQKNTMGTSSLAAGEYAVVLGEPNMQGEIVAGLIRVIPIPAGMKIP